MSNTMKMSLSTKPMHPFSRKQMGFSENPILFKAPNLIQLDLQKLDLIKTRVLASFRGEAASVAQSLDNSLMSIPLQQILSEEHFNRVIDQQSVIIVWVANWCRKCIYLKPKLEKLAAHYHPSIRFYSVDVNNVSHKLVSQAEVTKMPTIQLWSDGKKQGEVIGGHNKAFLVVNEVRDMIENESSSL